MKTIRLLAMGVGVLLICLPRLVLAQNTVVRLHVRPAANLTAHARGARPNQFYNCSLNVTSMAFGNYNVFATAETDTTASIAIKCYVLGKSKGTISLGTGSSGSYISRTMQSGTSILNYNLYNDVNHNTVLGDGSNNTTTIQVTGRGFGWGSGTLTIYGKIPARQNVSPGSYSDTVNVTMTY